MIYHHRFPIALSVLLGLVAILLAGCVVSPIPVVPTPSPTAAVEDGGLSIRLSPTQGIAGAAVTVIGNGWPPSQLVNIYLQDPRTGQVSIAPITVTQVGDDGLFHTSFTYPSDPAWNRPGQVLVMTRAAETGEQAAVGFWVLAPEQPTTQPPGLTPSAPTATPVPPATSASALVTAFALNLRLGPSTQYGIITIAEQGTGLTVMGQDSTGNWLFIRLEDGTEGWVARAYTNFTGRVPVVTTTARPAPTPGPVAAWRGEYFSNRTLSGAPALVRSDPRISFNWGGGAPAAALPADDFSVRWSRSLIFPAGTYRFSVRSDDGVRVWLDGTQIIDAWRDTSGSELLTAERQISAGQHSLRVEYYEHQGQAQIQFWWERPGNYAQWRGEYFTGTDLAGTPVLVRNDRTISFDWAGGSPSNRIAVDRFSIRWMRTTAFEEGLYRFRVTADDGVRLFVDGNLVIDAWSEGYKSELTADVRLPAGQHSLRVEYYENTGNALIRMDWARVTAYPDWLAEYWDNRQQQGTPKLVRNDQTIDFNWGNGSPAAGIPVDSFSARWSRTIGFEAGTYRFRVLVDDGARLWIDDQLIVDAWQDGSSRELTGEVALTQGSHTLRLSFYEHIGDARIRLTWERVLSPVFTDWKGEYFANRNLAGTPALTRNDRSIDFQWGNQAPASGLPVDQFSVRWSRTMDFRPGTYRLFALSDDGVRVFIDGNLVLDAWYDQGGTQVHSVDLLLSGSRRVAVEYYESAGGARITFQWAQVGEQPTATPTPTVTPTPQAPTATPTVTPTPQAPTATPTVTPTPAVPTPTPTVTPTPAVPTPTATPTVEPPAAGTVEGTVCWPEDATADSALVYLQPADGGAPVTAEVSPETPSYRVTLPPGEYTVYAWLADLSSGAVYPGTILVSAGDTLTGIDLCGWGDPGVPPPPTVR